MEDVKMTDNLGDEITENVTVNEPKIDNTKTEEHVDIFQWANLTDGAKNDLDVEFFLFNKNFIPYTTSFSSELNSQIKPLFLFDLINFVNMGAGTGLSVRDFAQYMTQIEAHATQELGVRFTETREFFDEWRRHK
jgi:hypothetical protein